MFSTSTVARRLPVVALDSSDARMPLPRVEMYLAVSRSSSAKGLPVSNLEVRQTWARPRLAGLATRAPPTRRAAARIAQVREVRVDRRFEVGTVPMWTCSRLVVWTRGSSLFQGVADWSPRASCKRRLLMCWLTAPRRHEWRLVIEHKRQAAWKYRQCWWYPGESLRTCTK